MRRDGTATVWQAEGSISGRHVRMTLTSGPASAYPAQLEILWGSGPQSVALRMIRSERRDYPEDLRLVRYFRPDAPARPPAVAALDVKVAPALPTAHELLAADVEAASVIHRAKLCLGGEVEAQRAANAVVITGSVADAYRREQLTELFDALPSARFFVLRVEGAEAGALPPVPAKHSDTSAPAPKSQSPAELWLRKRLRVGDRITEREMYDLMTSVVTAAEDLSSEAAAWRRIRERYSKSDLDQMGPETRSLLRSIEEDHILAVLGQVMSLKNTLAFGNFPEAADPGAANPTAFEPGAALQEHARYVNTLVLRLFSSTADPPGNSALDPDREFATLLVSIERLRLVSVRLRQAITAESAR